jgi:murein DD-endopeptidase MepM/ murein hydrolase activator NlpD
MRSTSPEAATDSTRGRKILLLILLFALGACYPRPPPAPATPAAPPMSGSVLARVAVDIRPSRPVAVVQDPGRIPALRMPVTGPVVRGFELPAGRYGPGHRGIDILAPAGEPVRAPAAGRIVFAGPVAGTSWISLEVAPGVLVTMGPLRDPEGPPGRRVPTRTPLGRLAPGHGAAALAGWVAPGAAAALHLSVRVDGVYVDPLPHLVDRPRPRLAPLLAPGGLPEP